LLHITQKKQKIEVHNKEAEN